MLGRFGVCYFISYLNDNYLQYLTNLHIRGDYISGRLGPPIMLNSNKRLGVGVNCASRGRTASMTERTVPQTADSTTLPFTLTQLVLSSGMKPRSFTTSTCALPDADDSIELLQQIGQHFDLSGKYGYNASVDLLELLDRSLHSYTNYLPKVKKLIKFTATDGTGSSAYDPETYRLKFMMTPEQDQQLVAYLQEFVNRGLRIPTEQIDEIHRDYRLQLYKSGALQTKKLLRNAAPLTEVAHFAIKAKTEIFERFPLSRYRLGLFWTLAERYYDSFKAGDYVMRRPASSYADASELHRFSFLGDTEEFSPGDEPCVDVSFEFDSPKKPLASIVNGDWSNSSVQLTTKPVAAPQLQDKENSPARSPIRQYPVRSPARQSPVKSPTRQSPVRLSPTKQSSQSPMRQLQLSFEESPTKQTEELQRFIQADLGSSLVESLAALNALAPKKDDIHVDDSVSDVPFTFEPNSGHIAIYDDSKEDNDATISISALDDTIDSAHLEELGDPINMSLEEFLSFTSEPSGYRADDRTDDRLEDDVISVPEIVERFERIGGVVPEQPVTEFTTVPAIADNLPSEPTELFEPIEVDEPIEVADPAADAVSQVSTISGLQFEAKLEDYRLDNVEHEKRTINDRMNAILDRGMMDLSDSAEFKHKIVSPRNVYEWLGGSRAKAWEETSAREKSQFYDAFKRHYHRVIYNPDPERQGDLMYDVASVCVNFGEIDLPVVLRSVPEPESEAELS